MTLKTDAVFLAGFIVGTYDLRGDAGPPAYLQPFLDRILTAPESNDVSIIAAPQIFVHGRGQPADASASKDERTAEGSPQTPPTEPAADNSEDTGAAFSTSNEAEETDATIPEKKPRKPWSQESRDAAAARAIARGFGKKRISEVADPKITLEPVSSFDSDDTQPAGKRGYGTLGDEDWLDVKKMRDNGLPETRIASSFDVELDYLLDFIERMDERDKITQGNF